MLILLFIGFQVQTLLALVATLGPIINIVAPSFHWTADIREPVQIVLSLVALIVNCGFIYWSVFRPVRT